MLLFDLAKWIVKINNEQEEERENERLKDLEERMDALDLDDDERELVLSGDYEPEDFETDEDELEESDYYYKD